MKPLGLDKLGAARWHRRVVLGAGAAALGGVCAWRNSRAPRPLEPTVGIKLPVTIVDGMAGALGEFAQILVLYPLDTVKASGAAGSLGILYV
ncbi:hypothetical protein TSOC_004592 [Tetrabaena socialis]|uniref:Uncharacterized protein n=1 Tax=Tetrabaena socialis TaxID=47790 RepID=A0A2J8A8Q5_9CHLO|nr:hypothetical protein TSOC_004592 [Tetrabaena socialis]|eukprot:PNH08843.1 hypothetical protein TSOC_004592 [Tetrabaena socialis]